MSSCVQGKDKKKDKKEKKEKKEKKDKHRRDDERNGTDDRHKRRHASPDDRNGKRSRYGWRSVCTGSHWRCRRPPGTATGSHTRPTAIDDTMTIGVATTTDTIATAGLPRPVVTASTASTMAHTTQTRLLVTTPGVIHH